MLSKVAHYSGFQSYSDLPYPQLKPGRKTLESNTVYQGTVRSGDELKFYDNSQRYKTVYAHNVSEKAKPEDYFNPLKVTKEQVEKPLLATTGRLISTSLASTTKSETLKSGTADKGDRFASSGVDLYTKTVGALKKNIVINNAISQQLESKAEHKDDQFENTSDNQFVQTGVEHWKTTYASGIKDPYSYARSSRPDWSLNKDPYTVSNGPLQSEYKVQFGERGENPLDKFPSGLTAPPKSEDTLKLGTTQSSFHVPGYTGYIPKTLTSPDYWDQARGTNPRTTIVKQNITENFHKRIPGYSGHKPRNARNDRGTIRPFCFSTMGETFH